VTPEPETPVEREEYTAEMRAHNEQQIVDFVEYIRSQRPPDQRGEPKPRYLTRAQLIESYRRGLNDPLFEDGARAALIRLGDNEVPPRARAPEPKAEPVEEPPPW
jgi:hypothetical protein